jgi:VanZ family protein
MTVRLFWRGVFALLLAFVTWQTLTADPDDTKPSLAIARYIAELLFHNEKFGDKVAHFLAYAALAGAGAFSHFAYRGRRSPAILALAAYGVLLEFLQGLGGVRSPEFADAVANASGALAAFPAAILVEHAIQRLKRA